MSRMNEKVGLPEVVCIDEYEVCVTEGPPTVTRMSIKNLPALTLRTIERTRTPGLDANEQLERHVQKSAILESSDAIGRERTSRTRASAISTAAVDASRAAVVNGLTDLTHAVVAEHFGVVRRSSLSRDDRILGSPSMYAEMDNEQVARLERTSPTVVARLRRMDRHAADWARLVGITEIDWSDPEDETGPGFESLMWSDWADATVASLAKDPRVRRDGKGVAPAFAEFQEGYGFVSGDRDHGVGIVGPICVRAMPPVDARRWRDQGELVPSFEPPYIPSGVPNRLRLIKVRADEILRKHGWTLHGSKVVASVPPSQAGRKKVQRREEAEAELAQILAGLDMTELPPPKKGKAGNPVLKGVAQEMRRAGYGTVEIEHALGARDCHVGERTIRVWIKGIDPVAQDKPTSLWKALEWANQPLDIEAALFKTWGLYHDEPRRK